MIFLANALLRIGLFMLTASRRTWAPQLQTGMGPPVRMEYLTGGASVTQEGHRLARKSGDHRLRNGSQLQLPFPRPRSRSLHIETQYCRCEVKVLCELLVLRIDTGDRRGPASGAQVIAPWICSR
ncbi:hypothetical protein BDP55DRAFT_641101 [Colletotrichum godetiae]|uniref:Secreted protein n=1 Tax=Colletotrichum godetiae TaxID=1209918 RepID=A0AAJ0F5B7_9PEZI|nr:uncharacterized protein BDP55DRAFT_641101 [Colletotrichum godetiae]KAK1701283.1 hypothetical protein BDP55DRAFT_641101 [Colletotrichum godetiae]